MIKLFKIIKFAVSGFLIVYLLLSIDIESVFQILLESKFIYLIVAFILIILGVIISSFKWKLLLSAKSVIISLKKAVYLYFIGFFFNNFLPANIGGDTVRGYYLSKNSQIKLSTSFASITIERITGVVALIFFILIGIFLNWRLVEKLNIIHILSIFILIFLILIALLFSRKLRRVINSRFNFKTFSRLSTSLKNLYNSINVYRGEKKVVFQSLIISFIFQAIVIINAYLYILAVDNYITILQLVFIIPLISLAGLIPISINGIGVTEGAFVYFFTILGLSSAEALSIALLARGVNLAVSLLGGIFYLLIHR